MNYYAIHMYNFDELVNFFVQCKFPILYSRLSLVPFEGYGYLKKFEVDLATYTDGVPSISLLTFGRNKANFYQPCSRVDHGVSEGVRGDFQWHSY